MAGYKKYSSGRKYNSAKTAAETTTTHSIGAKITTKPVTKYSYSPKKK